MWTIYFLGREHPRAALGSIGLGHQSATTLQGPSFFLNRRDQALRREAPPADRGLGVRKLGIDPVFGKQRRTEITNSNWLCE